MHAVSTRLFMLFEALFLKNISMKNAAYIINISPFKDKAQLRLP